MVKSTAPTLRWCNRSREPDSHQPVRRANNRRPNPNRANRLELGRRAVSRMPHSADPADVESIDAIIAATYDVISGPAGKKRDWDRERSLFVPGARLIPTATIPGKTDVDLAPLVLDVEGYIARVEPLFEKEGFYEKEIARRVERFGQIAHVWS